MLYRWNYAVGGVPDTEAKRLRKLLITHSQPSLSLLAMSDHNYSNNLLALYLDNPAWRAIIDDAAASHAKSYLNSTGVTSESLVITAHLVTEHEPKIS